MKTKIIIVLLLFHYTNGLSQESRGVQFSKFPKSDSIGEFHIVIFAEESYDDTRVNDLKGPIAESDMLIEVLNRKYQFKRENIYRYIDPDKEEILYGLEKLSRKLKEEDNLIIYYSGHGGWNEDERMGYWFPSDFVKGEWESAISNNQIKDWIDQFESRHVLLISDACFSGSIFKSRTISGMSKFEDRIFYHKSRKAMTSGMLQEVPETSIFMSHIINYLENNTDKFLLAQDLFYGIQRDVAMSQESKSKNTVVPLYATITGCDDQNGDFIFFNKSGEIKREYQYSENGASFQKLALNRLDESISLGKIFQFPETPIDYLGNARVYNIMGMPNESAKAYLNFFSLSVTEPYLEPHFEFIALMNEIEEDLKIEYLKYIDNQDNEFYDFISIFAKDIGLLARSNALEKFIEENSNFSYARIENIKTKIRMMYELDPALHEDAFKNVSWNKMAENIDKHKSSARLMFLRASDFNNYFTKEDEMNLKNYVNLENQMQSLGTDFNTNVSLRDSIYACQLGDSLFILFNMEVEKWKKENVNLWKNDPNLKKSAQKRAMYDIEDQVQDVIVDKVRLKLSQFSNIILQSKWGDIYNNRARVSENLIKERILNGE